VGMRDGEGLLTSILSIHRRGAGYRGGFAEAAQRFSLISAPPQRSLRLRGASAVPGVVFKGSEEMQRGFLQGLFSSDGTVHIDAANGNHIRLTSISEMLLREPHQLLLTSAVPPP